MEAIETGGTAQRKVSTAVTLSLVMSGLGHLYCGCLIAGLAWAAAAALTVPLVFVAMLQASRWLALAALVAAIVWIAAAAHAAIIARRLGGTYQLREYNRGIVYALLLVIGSVGSLSYALLVRTQYAEAFVMASESMAPTLLKGDRVLALKTVYQREGVARGDVLVFKNPEEPSQRWIKRVVGLPGDVVEVRQGVLWLNGERVTQPDGYGGGKETVGGRTWSVMLGEEGQVPDSGAVTVPPHHVYVLADNRVGTRDSRQIGPVTNVAIVGRVETVYWPAEDWSRFGSPD